MLGCGDLFYPEHKQNSGIDSTCSGIGKILIMWCLKHNFY